MSVLAVTRSVLACDGCKQFFNEGEQFVSPVEARGAAYAAGWKFPPRLTKSGGAASTCSDVCPECAPGWEPQPIQARPSRQLRDGSTR